MRVLKIGLSLILAQGLAILLVAACAAPGTAPTANTAALQQKVLIAEIAYEAPLSVAVAYNKRPRCTVPRTIVTCSEPTVVDQTRKINRSAMVVFDRARQIAGTPGVSEGQVMAQLTIAASLTSDLQAVIAAYNK